MSRINVGRVILGGLAAGVVANGLDYVINNLLLRTENNEMVQRLNLRPDVVEGSWVAWLVVDFIYAFILVFAYAAMRPRFGPGPKTATIVGLTYWLAVTVVFAGLTAMGIFTQQGYIKTAALSIASTLIPIWVGAAIYKED
jgi:hypothetical protein